MFINKWQCNQKGGNDCWQDNCSDKNYEKHKNTKQQDSLIIIQIVGIKQYSYFYLVLDHTIQLSLQIEVAHEPALVLYIIIIIIIIITTIGGSIKK